MKSNPNLVQVLFEMSLFLTQLPVQPRVLTCSVQPRVFVLRSVTLSIITISFNL